MREDIRYYFWSDFPFILICIIVIAVVLFAVFGPCIHLFESDTFCSSCGKQLRYFCPGCNNSYRTSSYCPICGFDLSTVIP